MSWDGETFAIMDETGGGGTAECDGSASQDGFYYFYDVVKPGDPAPPLKSRYTIPRAQTPEICVSHNANVIPIKGRKLMAAAYYQGGNTVVDFTDPSNIREVAYSDLEDARQGRLVVDVLVQRPHLHQRRPQRSRATGNRGWTVRAQRVAGNGPRAPRPGATRTRRRRRRGRPRRPAAPSSDDWAAGADRAPAALCLR